MRIRYIGNATVRRIGRYSWNAENDFVQDVEEPQFATELLTYPTPQFEAVDAVSEDVVSFVEGEFAKHGSGQETQTEQALPKKAGTRVRRPASNAKTDKQGDEK